MSWSELCVDHSSLFWFSASSFFPQCSFAFWKTQQGSFKTCFSNHNCRLLTLPGQRCSITILAVRQSAQTRTMMAWRSVWMDRGERQRGDRSGWEHHGWRSKWGSNRKKRDNGDRSGWIHPHQRKTLQKLLSPTRWRVEVMLYTMLFSLAFVFPHMVVISRNLPGFVKWQPDREWGIMFCWQNLTLWYKMLWLPRYALANTLTAQESLRCAFCFLSSILQVQWHVAICQHSAMSLLLIKPNTPACQSSRSNFMRCAGIEIAGISGLTLSPPTSHPASKCPDDGVWNCTERDGSQAGELKAKVIVLSKKKPQNLL